MKLLFIIPPFVDITAPLLGLPFLVAYLKCKSFSDIHIMDLNIEFLDFLSESDYLEKQACLIIEDFEILDRLGSLERSQYKKYQHLVSLYGFCVTKGYKNLNYYMNFLREKETFYDVSRYSNEVLTFFHLCFQLVNYKSPASISFLFYTSNTNLIPEGEHIFSRYYEEKVLPRISRLRPDIIGFSVCYEFQFFHAMYLGKRIKKNHPSIFVVVGGTHMKMMQRDFQEGNIDFFSSADAYVIGEGEIPMNALLLKLQEGGKDLSSVPGLFYMDNQNQVQVTEPSHPIPLDELPLPDFTDLPLDKYLSFKNVIPYRVSRGCYWNKCAFCSHFQTREFSFKKARHVLEDIKKLMTLYKTDFIYFVDDALPQAFLEKFADLSIAKKIDVKWLGNIRPEKFLTEPFIQKMAQAGCREVYLGIESASQKLLDAVHKGIDINTVKQIVNDCHKHSISIKMNFISGLPFETSKDICQTIRFIKNNAKNCDIICLTPVITFSAGFIIFFIQKNFREKSLNIYHPNIFSLPTVYQPSALNKSR